MKNFWQELKKPIFILAPMEDVTDTVFRRVILETGRPDVFFTEFTNTDGMISPKGTKQVTQRLQYTEAERPLVAQIWGNNPESFYQATKMVVERGFDGVDINMGCPERKVVKRFAGGGCIRDPKLAKEIIIATQEAAKNKIPVSVKTRIGVKTIITEEWTSMLLDQHLAALTVHLRTVAEESKVPAHWDEIAKVKRLRDEKGVNTLIFGNGDIKSIAQAKEKIEQYGIDGVMVGTGIFENPWLFNEKIDPTTISLEERIKLLRKHMYLFEETWGSQKNFNILRKYFKIYVSGLPGAQDLRSKLILCNNSQEVESILSSINL